MNKLSNLTGLIAVILLIGCPILPASEGENAFQRGSQLLTKGDLQGALTAFGEAAESDRSNLQYASQFMLLRRVLAVQDAWELEFDPARRLQMGQALRAFYVDHGLFNRALPIDQASFKERPTAQTAAQLAETQLALNNHDEAVTLLSDLQPSQSNPTTRALLSIALIRQGQLNEARQIAAKVSAPPPFDGTALYAVARMQAALGREEMALRSLTQAFQASSPGRLTTLKAHASKSPELARIATSDGFKKAMQTESKVAESGCSSGSTCSSCPSRKACPSGRQP